MAVKYIDVNSMVGRRGLKHPREIWSTDDVLKSMDRAHIDAAVVVSAWSRDYSPNYGNERLLAELSRSKRLYGSYTIVPNVISDSPTAEQMTDFMRRHRLVAARMFPRSHFFAPDERTMGSYYAALAAAGYPLMVDSSELDFRELQQILTAHPNLNVIYLGVYWHLTRLLVPLLDGFPRLHIDFSQMQANAIIERLVKRLGAKQLLYGSGLPRMSPGAARAFIDYADISAEDKALIAHGNAERLFRINPSTQNFRSADELVETALRGEPLPLPVFDSHTHILGDPYEAGGQSPMLEGDLEPMSRLYARMGVTKYCVAPWLGIWTDKPAGNQAVIEMTRQQPEAVYGLMMVDPAYSEDDVRAQAELFHLKYRIPGMKTLFARSKIRYTNPAFAPWWEIGNANKLFALMDPGAYPQFLGDMAELADRYPDIAFFLDHAGRDWDAAESNTALAKRYPNLYLQHTYTSNTEGVIEYFVESGMEDRLLYGTDSPMRDPRPQLGWIVYANISEAAKRKILSGNMHRLLRRAFDGGPYNQVF